MSGESNDSAQLPAPEIARPRLLDRVHEAIHRRFYSRRMEEAYVHWIRRFTFFNGKRHPEAMGEAEVTAFLNHLATERRVAAATSFSSISMVRMHHSTKERRRLDVNDGPRRQSPLC
jgi:hypothetical protein